MYCDVLDDILAYCIRSRSRHIKEVGGYAAVRRNTGD